MSVIASDSSQSKKTTCPYCGVGCGVTADVKEDRITAVCGTSDHPANKSLLCVKGSALHETNSMEGRLLSPFVDAQEASWDVALDRVAKGFSDTIREHGPDSVAFYLSGQLLTEDYYIANKLMKGFIGSANVDTNSRLCMASAVAGYKRAFGSDTVPGNYEDLENCNLLVMVGSNAAWTHPVLYQRISAAKKRNPQMKVVVIDPKKTATADIADLFLAIEPGSDAALFNGLFSHLAQNNSYLDNTFIDAHTQGFDAAIASAEIQRKEVMAQTGLSEEELSTFYDWFAEEDKTVTFYSQGINQSASGTDKCNAIINCHLATGRIGKAGMGPFSITGQPNAMGGREVGGLANQLAAHMDFSEENCDRLGRFWGSDKVARQPGLKAIDLFQGIEEGRIKAVWIMATNPVVSMPEADRVKNALAKCPLVVVSDCVAQTDTTALADVLLPASGWGEKDGTVTNSERRISRQRALVSKPGFAKHDWEIIGEVARRMGYTEGFNYQGPSEIFAEHAALSGFENSGQRDFDISKYAQISEQEYQSFEPVQWPVNAANPQGTSRMFADGHFYTANGKANFIALSCGENTATTSAETPYLLNTGRVRDQWHTMTRTGKSSRLMNHRDTPYLEINTQDALAEGIQENDLVEVSNSCGFVRLPARINNSLKPGQIFAPIHWNDQFAFPARIDTLIPNRADPISGQPESKNVPVQIQRQNTKAWLRILSSDLDFAKNLVSNQGAQFWARINCQGSYRFDIALESENELDGYLEALKNSDLNFTTKEFASYLFRCDGRNQSFIQIAKKYSALPQASFAESIIGAAANANDWLCLAGRSGKENTQGAMICSCYEVYEEEISQSINQGAASAAELGNRLKCGTNCGSCIPELNGMIASHQEQCTPDADAA